MSEKEGTAIDPVIISGKFDIKRIKGKRSAENIGISIAKDSTNKTDLSNSHKLPFRSGVGMMILDKNNRIFVGKRIDSKTNGWQMPQGGIDLGETPSAAALREMAEEIGSSKGEIIAESKKWYSYRLPEFLIHRLWGGKYCGQKQKWFLIRFTGQDSDINIKTKHPEFSNWKWIAIHELLDNIIPFKHKLYSKVMAEFKEFIELKK